MHSRSRVRIMTCTVRNGCYPSSPHPLDELCRNLVPRFKKELKKRKIPIEDYTVSGNGGRHGDAAGSVSCCASS